ncbi:hypothetical protein Pve01_18130 [Planomonospora venezuelensis]|nr:hypothetical protein Pve01_18130 [Planomonospora venezuelensis]
MTCFFARAYRNGRGTKRDPGGRKISPGIGKRAAVFREARGGAAAGAGRAGPPPVW